ncbi:MAG: tRNA (N6-isopentenyl adenosine(37)-C2)-methylthiotransferase MiaB [Clostridia bacterium]|nr:tRNA (N6-isopentenyl adenosine(37)-C2)-methylthiotransferase MiaB [Clostridia bacterium]
MQNDLELKEICQKVKDKLTKHPSYVYIHTFGCQQNVADGEKMRGLAEWMGYTSTDRADEADLILFNTCAIREHAEVKALSVVGQYKHLWEKNPDLMIGVAGCMTAQAHRVEQIKQHYPYITFTLAPGALHELPRAVYTALSKEKGARRPRRSFYMDQITDEVVEGLPIRRTEPHRAWVSIMYGCNNFCSYCIVPYVRGRERSRASADILAEVSQLLADGVKEITLLGQNVNSYRGDCDFATLLEKLALLDGDFVLHFMTSHPKDVPDKLIEVMAKYPEKIAPHFHLPLQSGSDKILHAMNRHYDFARYLSIVEKLRRAIPHIAITSDIIVGFPGETEQDFEQTLNALSLIRFDMVYAFIYSARRGTKAAEHPDQIPASTKKDRMKRLLLLQDQISAECAQRMDGQVVRVLVDGLSTQKAGLYSGRTNQNKLVHIPSEVDITGQYVTVKIHRADPYALYGEVISCD